MMTAACIVYWSATVALGMVALAFAITTVRLVMGPRAQDRIMAADTMSGQAIIFMLIISIRGDNPHNLPAILILAIASAASSIAMAKFLMRGEVIE